MKLTQWTVFIDILGFKELNEKINNEKSALNLIEYMKSNIELNNFQNSPHVIGQYKNQDFNLYDFYDVKFAFVSDSICFTFYPKEVSINRKDPILDSANTLLIIFMRLHSYIENIISSKGLFIRGGISTKYAYIEDNFIVGEGVIEAYLTESTIAKNPRITLSKSVMSDKKLLTRFNFLSKIMYGTDKIIKKDENGNYFYNYLRYQLASIDYNVTMVGREFINNQVGYFGLVDTIEMFFKNHKQAIVKAISELEDRIYKSASDREKETLKKVMSKYIWLKNYHNDELINNKILNSIFDKYIIK